MQQDFQGKTISVEDLLGKYQQINHEKNWLDTVKGLATKEPQQSPLYFILPSFWVQLFCPQVAAVRSLSSGISLLVFPRVYWLCGELFRSASVGWMAVTIVAAVSDRTFNRLALPLNPQTSLAVGIDSVRNYSDSIDSSARRCRSLSGSLYFRNPASCSLSIHP
jgi:Predicted membrane protein